MILCLERAFHFYHSYFFPSFSLISEICIFLKMKNKAR